MAKVKITAKNKSFIGRRASVAFVDGKAEIDVDATDPAAEALIGWFARNGYGVDGPHGGWKTAKPEPEPEPTAPTGDGKTAKE
jgi:hypothetical protein